MLSGCVDDVLGVAEHHDVLAVWEVSQAFYDSDKFHFVVRSNRG